MKHLKYILTITNTSFTLVVLLNALFLQSTISSHMLMIMFLTCLSIGVGTVFIDCFSFVHEHGYLCNYMMMFIIVFFVEYVNGRHFRLINTLIEIVFLTVIYAGVCFALYCIHDYQAEQINQKIQRMKRK